MLNFTSNLVVITWRLDTIAINTRSTATLGLGSSVQLEPSEAAENNHNEESVTNGTSIWSHAADNMLIRHSNT